jgi:hypothetical protein
MELQGLLELLDLLDLFEVDRRRGAIIGYCRHASLAAFAEDVACGWLSWAHCWRIQDQMHASG